MEERKLIIIGWDGATFDVIKPLIRAGRMPVIASLLENGVHGRLVSTIPPLTPVAWTSIATGVNPGKHGIFDAMMFSRAGRKLSFINATNRKIKPFWTLLEESGKTTNVFNVPVTYPPDPVSGAMISGMFTPFGVRDFTYPAGLLDEVEARFGRYEIECENTDEPASYLKNIIEVEIDFREKVIMHLMDRGRWDLLYAVSMATDRVQHFYWGYLDPSRKDHAKYKDAIYSVYEKLDASLGRIIKKAGDNATVMMVSDHGSGPLKTAFFLNNWLIQNGYLSMKEGSAAPAHKAGGPRLLKKALKRILPAFVKDALRSRMIPDHNKEINVFSSFIDWTKTRAFSEGVSCGIYINEETVPREAYDETVDGIIGKLKALRGPDGNPVVERVYRRSEAYSGGYVDMAADLIVICAPTYQIIAPNEVLFFGGELSSDLFMEHKWSGRHEQEGIFVLSGEGVRKGVELKHCSLIDVAPTVLYLMGVDVPQDADGHVLEEALEKSYAEQHPIKSSLVDISQDGSAIKGLSEEEEAQLMERMRSLGYLE